MTGPKKEALKPPPRPEMPFSAVVGFGDLVFISGRIGRDPETNHIAPGDPAAQTEQIMKNIQADLEDLGLSLDNVLKSTVFLTDMRHFKLMNQAYLKFFAGEPPARSCVAVSGLPDPEALVEIEMIVHR